MKYRPHKGSLADSMALMVDVDGRAGLVRHLQEELRPFFREVIVNDDNVRLIPAAAKDDRIGWKNVHLVKVDGYGVMGFCEGDGQNGDSQKGHSDQGG